MKKTPCRLCFYWERPTEQHETRGECHRRAPSPVADGIASVWPPTDPGEWCGDGIPAVEMQEQARPAPVVQVKPRARSVKAADVIRPTARGEATVERQRAGAKYAR